MSQFQYSDNGLITNKRGSTNLHHPQLQRTKNTALHFPAVVKPMQHHRQNSHHQNESKGDLTHCKTTHMLRDKTFVEHHNGQRRVLSRNMSIILAFCFNILLK